MEAAISPEKVRARDLAEEYRRKGYEVIEEPGAEQLPDFLAGYRPDLLVKKETGAIVVEVESRSSLKGDPQASEIARILQTKPGWNFELVLMREQKRLDVPEGSRRFTREDVHGRLEAVNTLLEAGASEAAFLQTWATAEAALWILAENAGFIPDNHESRPLVSHAVINGLISREDYNFLMRAMKYRNALVHGYELADFDPAMIGKLADLTKSILEEAAATSHI